MVQGLTWTPGLAGPEVEWTDRFSGAGMIDTVAGLVNAAEDENKAAIAAYSVGLAFDVVGAALNPLGAVLGAGVGWLIDHIAFLREPLDLLVGDNIAIRQETEKVKDDAEKYEGIATTHLDALKKLDGWMGETAERFRASMAHVAKEIEAIGSAINGSAKLMATMGAVVTAVRSLVRDIVAMVIGNLIGGALIAAGLAPLTFGASIVTFIGVAVATALEALARIMRHVTKLKAILTGASKAADDLGAALVKLSDDAARFTKGGSSAYVPPPKPVKVPSGDAPAPSGGGGTSASSAKPPELPPIDTNVGKLPEDIPLPPSPGGGSPKPDAPSGSGTPKPDDTAPKPAGSGGGSKPPFSWAEVQKQMENLSKQSTEHLENVLTTKLGRTPEEAKAITQWIKNFEEVAAPGGHITIGGKEFATGSALHLVHELWKELSADVHEQEKNEGYLGELKNHNAQR
jgi:prepilin signal peptidase PulO-like enzyme (type II secretory pathway)